MNTRILVYSVLIADFFTFGIAFFIPIPSALTGLHSSTIGVFLTIAAIATIFYLIGIIGLFLFKRWGRVCYLISFILSIVALTQSLDFIYPLTAFDILGTIISLLVLCVIFGPASKEFK